MTQQNFLQYMQMLEERQHMTMEQQNKFFQELLQQKIGWRGQKIRESLCRTSRIRSQLSFAYAPEPIDAEDWLMDTERKLNTVGCNDLEKVRYATHLLCGPAASWWGNIVAVYPAEKVFTWEEFKRKFRESNVPESIVELKRREFESLEQKGKAILTYVREFSGLSRYAVEEVNTEDKKKKRLIRLRQPPPSRSQDLGTESLFRHPPERGSAPEGLSIDTAAISTAIFITAAPMRRSSSPSRLGLYR
ncbi:hypothetical protein QYE76_024959 [Lolium multiflorum]|uniref:Retrotransposon gag domain-containing protein n=1 Tax=Lolium multiflorum TaxID=4521 RepID=A0AAD8VTR1_LOLMU|nr:hypothetical protein QYE76_024959 [Lolium multiflorum]